MRTAADAYFTARDALLEMTRAYLAQIAKRPRRHAAPSLPSDFIAFAGHRIHASTVEGLGRMDEWHPLEETGFARRLEVKYGDGFTQQIGFRASEELWRVLKDKGAAAIKAHYALSAFCYHRTGGDGNEYVLVDVPEFCDALGYKRQKAGGFKTRDKQRAMEVLTGLTTAELSVEYAIPRRPGKVGRVRGRIWERGLEAEQRDQCTDLFGHARIGDHAAWEPVAFTFRPGQWDSDPGWRAANEYVGKIGAGLLQLDTKRDEWAVRIGGYYGFLARVTQYQQPCRVRVATVLKRTGLNRQNRRHPAAQLEAFQRAHDRLVEVGVLASWQFDTPAVEEEPDMDDPTTLATLAEYGEGDWRGQGIVLAWPAALIEHGAALAARQHKAITAAQHRHPRERASGVGGARRLPPRRADPTPRRAQ